MQRRLYARMTGGRRLQLALELSVTAREVTADGIRSRHPEYGEREVRHAINRMLLGDRLFRAAWPDAPLLDQ